MPHNPAGMFSEDGTEVVKLHNSIVEGSLTIPSSGMKRMGMLIRVQTLGPHRAAEDKTPILGVCWSVSGQAGAREGADSSTCPRGKHAMVIAQPR